VLTEDIRGGVNVALNESRFLSVQVDRAVRSAMVWFEGPTLPEDGPAPADTVVALVVRGVTRVAASLRGGAVDRQGSRDHAGHARPPRRRGARIGRVSELWLGLH
jgi:hypothetical protein